MPAHREFSDPFNFAHPSIAQIVTRAANIPGGKVRDTHMGSNTLVDAAYWYVQYYAGTFDFMLDLQRKASKGISLSSAQLAGALNCMLSEAKRQHSTLAPVKVAEPAVSVAEKITAGQSLYPLTETERAAQARHNGSSTVSHKLTYVKPVVRDGIYTIVLNEAGEYRTLRIVTADEDTRRKFDLPEGAQIASFLSGADNESDYMGFAFVFGPEQRIWGKFKNTPALSQALTTLLKADNEKQIDLGHAYALESNRCWRCNRKLTVPASINRGLGPICAEKL